MGCGASGPPTATAASAPVIACPVHNGMRVYAKYTGYRDQADGGPWFGATVRSDYGELVCLLYDDGDEAGDGKKAPAARLDELRFGESVPNGYKDAELPADTLPVCVRREAPVDAESKPAEVEAKRAEVTIEEFNAALHRDLGQDAAEIAADQKKHREEEKKHREEAAARIKKRQEEAAARPALIWEGMRCYAKYTGYRDQADGGPWFGATVRSVNCGQSDACVCLLYDDGDEAGPGKGAPAARFDELRFGTRTPIPFRYKDAELPTDASTEATQFNTKEAIDARIAKAEEIPEAARTEELKRSNPPYQDESTGLVFEDGVQQGLLHGCCEHIPALVKGTLANGADVNTIFQSFLPLHRLCQFWDRGDAGPEILAALVGAGANMNSRDPHGDTPLFTAIEYKHLKLAATLVTDHGADVNLYGNSDRCSPLMRACSSMSIDTMPLVELLLERGADINQQDCDGYTALVYAGTSGNSDVLDLIKQKGGKDAAFG